MRRIVTRYAVFFVSLALLLGSSCAKKAAEESGATSSEDTTLAASGEAAGTEEETSGGAGATEESMKSGEAAAEGETPGEATEEGTESGESEAPAATRETAPEEKTEGQEWRQKPGRYALIFTSQAKGPIVCELYPDKAPKTVENFVGLAKGTKEWTDPKTGKKVKKPFYNGLIFHRVIPDFMIQGGCPLGNGRGGPGYQFEDEFDSSLRFDRPGRLAMANSGPNTNGSQFFITTGEPSHLNDLHTIFGQVVQGQEVVEAISQVDRDADDRPLKPVTIAKILIEEVKAKER